MTAKKLSRRGSKVRLSCSELRFRACDVGTYCGTDSYTPGFDGDIRSEKSFVFSGVDRALRALPPEPLFPRGSWKKASKDKRFAVFAGFFRFRGCNRSFRLCGRVRNAVRSQCLTGFGGLFASALRKFGQHSSIQFGLDPKRVCQMTIKRFGKPERLSL